jgi:glycosidase
MLILFNRPRILGIFLIALVSLLSPSAGASTPQQSQENSSLRITKLDPPNWWIGFTPEIMLVISGDHLGEAEVTCDYPGLRISRTRHESGGHYIFVWLDISTATHPGVAILKAANKTGISTVEIPLLARADPYGRYQGVSPDDIIYMIMPDRFADGDLSNDQPPQSPGSYNRNMPRAYHGGDLRGIIDHLAYLHDLGVTTLWLSPIYDNDNRSPQDYHGYSAVDFYAVDEHLGTMHDFQELVQAAHRSGIKVVLDVVVNHTGPRHTWVKLPPSPAWFHGDVAHHTDSTGALDALADIHAPLKEYRRLLDGWFANVLPDLNQDNPLVREYFVQNALWWTESSGLDGLRLDTFPYVPRSFWSQWHAALSAKYPELTTIGEVFNREPSVTAFFAGGLPRSDGIDTGVSTVFDFPFYFAMRDVIIHNASVRSLVEILRHDWMYPHPDSLVTFLGNHDVRRFISEPKSSANKLKLAFSVLLTSRGIPQIYSGDEIGLPGGADPDNRRDFPGGFPGDQRNAFSPTGRNENEEAIFTHVHSLLHLRSEHPALRHGQQWNLEYDDNHYIFLRMTDREKIVVVFNNDNKPRVFSSNVADTPLAGSTSIAPLFGAGLARFENGKLQFHAAPASVAIYQVK